MRLVVRPITSFGLSPATSRISAFAAATAPGPDVSTPRCAGRPPRRAPLRARLRGPARARVRARAPKRAPVRNSSRAADAPIFAQHVRRDHRRQDAQLHFGEPERRVVRGDDDVADRGEADAAAERRAVDAADRPASAACRARSSIRARSSASAGSPPGCRRSPSTSRRGRRRRRTPCRRRRARRRARCDRRRRSALQAVSAAMNSSSNAFRTSGRLSVTAQASGRRGQTRQSVTVTAWLHPEDAELRHRESARSTPPTGPAPAPAAYRPDRGSRRPRAGRSSSTATSCRTSRGSAGGLPLLLRRVRVRPSRAS